MMHASENINLHILHAFESNWHLGFDSPLMVIIISKTETPRKRSCRMKHWGYWTPLHLLPVGIDGRVCLTQRGTFSISSRVWSTGIRPQSLQSACPNNSQQRKPISDLAQTQSFAQWNYAASWSSVNFSVSASLSKISRQRKWREGRTVPPQN